MPKAVEAQSAGEQFAKCRHGWRGSPEHEPICDPCPSCGARSLFVGKGGYLTCSSLQCKQPGVGREIERLRAELADRTLANTQIAEHARRKGRAVSDALDLDALAREIVDAYDLRFPDERPKLLDDLRSALARAVEAERRACVKAVYDKLHGIELELEEKHKLHGAPLSGGRMALIQESGDIARARMWAVAAINARDDLR